MPEEIGAEALGSLLESSVGAEGTGAGLTATGGTAGGTVSTGAGVAGGSGAFDTALASELGGGTATVGPNAFLGASGTGAGTVGLTGGGSTDFNQSLTADSVSASGLGIGQATGPTTGSSGFSWPSISQLASGGNILSSLYGMDQASQLKKLALAQANKATPWTTSGGGDQAAQQLLALISGKTDVSTLPGYGAGLQAVQRQGAANGWLGSGNMMAALQQYGGKFYNDAVTQLGGLAGANFNPVSAGSLATTGATNSAALSLAAMSNINKTVSTQPAWQ